MSFKSSFRLISFSCHDAATNMAIDEAILECHLHGHVPPTLRIYQFSPAAVSFGYAQKIDNNIIDRIQKQNFSVVRRPTGGRAVLHMGDITYSFICSGKSADISDYALVDDSIAVAYKQICQALRLALNSFGIETTIGSKGSRYEDKQDCFLATTIADLQYKGKKIAGSAQLRRRTALLQHGSIILNQPQTLLPQLLDKELNVDIAFEQPDRQNAHHANLFELLDFEPTLPQLEAALKYGFEQVFHNQFLPMPLTDQENDLAAKLVLKFKTI